MHTFVVILALFFTALYFIIEAVSDSVKSKDDWKPSKSSVQKPSSKPLIHKSSAKPSVPKQPLVSSIQDSSVKSLIQELPTGHLAQKWLRSVENKEVQVIRKTSQTKFIKSEFTGALALHDNGKITVNMGHKALFNRLEYKKTGSYFTLHNPSENDIELIVYRLLSE